MKCFHIVNLHYDHRDQMRQRLAQLEARLGRLRPEEPRPPSSPSDSIGDHFGVDEWSAKTEIGASLFAKKSVSEEEKKRKLFQTQRVLPCSSAPSPATTFSVTCLEGRPLPGLFVTIIIIIIIIIIVIMKIITMYIIIMIMIQAADQR